LETRFSTVLAVGKDLKDRNSFDNYLKGKRNKMKRMSKSNDKRKSRKKLSVVREQTQCRFCRQRTGYVDYKDIDVLQKLLTSRGKIFSRKRSGNCAGCQRKVQKAIKRARFMALLPYTN